MSQKLQTASRKLQGISKFQIAKCPRCRRSVAPSRRRCEYHLVYARDWAARRPRQSRPAILGRFYREEEAPLPVSEFFIRHRELVLP